MTHRFLL